MVVLAKLAGASGASDAADADGQVEYTRSAALSTAQSLAAEAPSAVITADETPSLTENCVSITSTSMFATTTQISDAYSWHHCEV